MVLDIVKQAVRTKMVCESESLLISPAEYCYACAYALQQLGQPAEFISDIGQALTIEELQKKTVPIFAAKIDDYKEQPPMYRLLRLLIHSRVTGEITEEIRKLMK